ncbi:S9 family peptidase [Cohnella cholangitidis]|uniref:Prolyl oligopeptidase family serine peptidase n=1 Tax=Cohnella cholangitidis TaxID=2598458 RepID=A0A7G5BZA5_9BACL|nr:alpha/beta fold hydrolase [Cohnella cholangitidis]QMV42289.1 prolyl oligopeptidase family serine peptidase [Cohnella cholangitidis]
MKLNRFKKPLELALVAALGLTLLLPTVQAGTVAAAGTSTQVIQDKYIAKLQELGFVNGTTDGMDQRTTPITRGEAAIILQKVLELPTPDSVTGFKDLKPGLPETIAVNALKEKGVVGGAGGNFLPNAPLTQEQMASLIVRAFQLQNNDIQATYSDAGKIAKYHRADAERLKQHFILEGNQFNPKNAVTHAEFAQALYRALNLDVAEQGNIPLEDFFRLPEQFGFQASPDGKYLAFLKPWNNRINIYVQKVGEKEATRVTSATERDIYYFSWASDTKLIYPQDTGGDENYHLYSVDVDGTDNKDLTPYPKVTVMLIDDLKDRPDEILIGLNKRDPRIFDAYRLNLNSGELTLAAENPGNITGWMTDNDSKIRIAISSDGIVSSLLYRETEDQPFKPLLTTKLDESFSPLMFTEDNKQLYALSNIGRDTSALVRYDLASNKIVETIYERTDSDVLGFIPNKKNKTIAAAIYETDKQGLYFFDKELEQEYRKLEGKLPGMQISVLGGSLLEDQSMIFAGSDRSYGTYYNYDRKSGELKVLAKIAPWLDEERMAEKKPISYQSRDGLTIHGYLTLPKGVDPTNLPVIINPHGGPWSRDSWGFSPEVQFLASRGYAVLQVNFRGSTGYGKKFLEAGNKEWGKAMQNDLSDGVQWLIKEGIADPKRVGIYGGSYGGYATLAGLAFTPELYAAGVDYVGVSNLLTFMETIPPYWESERAMFYARVGDPVKDKEMLMASSPIFHVDQIRAPLFVVQGANDPRVNQAESDQIVKALQARGVEVPYMLKANEGHGFANVENQLDFYRAMEKFLNRHLKQQQE